MLEVVQNTPELVMAFRVILATIFGAMVGFEREYVGKPAGVRTYALVAMGACIFTVLSIFGLLYLEQAPAGLGDRFNYNYDPTRIVSNIVVGIGFLGAGIIIFRGVRIEGLTTAAGLWVAAAIGATVGFGLYLLALIVVALELIVFYILKRVDAALLAKEAELDAKRREEEVL